MGWKSEQKIKRDVVYNSVSIKIKLRPIALMEQRT